MNSPVLFQSMPPLSPDEYAALEASIRHHGILVPITVDEHGVVIDGHHRQAIARSLGVECPTKQIGGLSDPEKRTMALTLNLDRRNLTREQRRAIVEASVKADPQLSDREHARRTGVSDKTVGSVRAELVESAEIPHFSRRIDPRTGNLSQPAERPGPAVATTDGVIIAQAERIDLTTGEVLDHPAGASNKVTGLDGKTYTRPEPKQRRTPLPDSFFNATYDLSRKAERLESLVNDDRFPQNRDKVAAKNRSDLVRAIGALNRVLAAIDNSQKELS